MSHFLFRIAAIVVFLLGILGGARAQTTEQTLGIHVLVYGVHQNGNVIYNYKVVNNGDKPFDNFTIGSKLEDLEGEETEELPQLNRLPTGWKYGSAGESGLEIILPPGSTNQPLNWSSLAYGKREVDAYSLNWHTASSDAAGIHPGQTLAGFSVKVPTLDLPILETRSIDNYLKGNFKVSFGANKNLQEVRGTIELEDITPPTLTLTLSEKAILTNEQLVPITATITVKDDYDPAPAINLEIVSAHGGLRKDFTKDAQLGTDIRQFQLKNDCGAEKKRIYTVVYSATDGSGNRAVAMGSVLVQCSEMRPQSDSPTLKP